MAKNTVPRLRLSDKQKKLRELPGLEEKRRMPLFFCRQSKRAGAWRIDKPLRRP